jgi:hypothetical protein
MIPVLSNPPLCRLSELKDGTYDIADVALMIDGLMMKADNEVIANEVRERLAKRR